MTNIDSPTAVRPQGENQHTQPSNLPAPVSITTLAPVQRPAMSCDLNVIQEAVVRAQRGEATVDVYVTPDGDVVAGNAPGREAERLSNVVGDTFYVDLNAIQAAVLAAQQNEGRVADKDRVYVDQNGDVMLGSDVGDPSRASAVVGDTFYARDVLAEFLTVQGKMPAAVKVTDGTQEGYAYSITNRFDDKYDLFIYYSQQYQVYRVALVAPRFGGEWDEHGGHLFSDGTLCLTRRAGSGYPSMEETYAKSALWTLGASLYRRGYGFQFNVGQDGDSRA